MSFKRMISVFGIGLLLCTVFRVLKLAEIVEYESGFFTEEKRVFGIVLSILIVLVCGAVAFLNGKVVKTYEYPPQNNIFLFVGAGLLAVSLLNEAFNQDFPVTVAPFQIGITRMAAVIAAAYFIILALSFFVKITFKPMVHIIPIIYFIIKTIFTFIGISPLALISDNALLMAGYCLSMLFFINYGKLFNGINCENNARKLLGVGFPAAIICISQSVAYFLVNIFGKEKYTHSDLDVMFTLLFIGLYIIAFTISCEMKLQNKKRV